MWLTDHEQVDMFNKRYVIIWSWILGLLGLIVWIRVCLGGLLFAWAPGVNILLMLGLKRHAAQVRG
jgi:hypothetical protein